MLDPQTERLAKTLLRELSARRAAWLLLAILISAGALTFGFLLPKQYTASARILVEDNNIVGPLMDGVAEQTEVSDLAAIVSELVLSRSLLDQILAAGGWLEGDKTLGQIEIERNQLAARTYVENLGGGLIRVSYRDVDPERAFLVANMYVEWIIEESQESKRRESMKAFEFIDSQVNEYQKQLIAAEEGLRQFRTQNLDALPESAAQVAARAMDLRQQSKILSLEMSELDAREQILRQQLSGEAEVTTALGTGTELRAQLVNLQRELSNLRLNYHDTYPDIIRLKAQIEDIENQLRNNDGLTGGVVANSSTNTSEQPINPLYQDLRKQLADTETRRITARARLKELESQLVQETNRVKRIGDAEAELAELTRDYEVNRDIYQDLLRRRERARVSMSMDQQSQGLIMKVQEQAAIPRAPSGLRFMHIALLGMVLSIAIPTGMTAALVQFDPRIRMKEQVEQLKLPVLTVVSEMHTRTRVLGNIAFVGGLAVLAAMYAVAAWLKLFGTGS
ncbi:MAG: Wzz/FepE/Etk N-terminal domain-containing protein [Xanthomonadales bacterium]|nr:Wzz/FepE/Etk N-terminal domain-containing protein [Xanthomonadales bacterium]